MLRVIRYYIFNLVPLAIFLSLTTCITSIDVEPSDFDDYLVVQGFIDDDFGPHNIRITRVTKFASRRDGGAANILKGAEVRIINQDGLSTVLKKDLVTEKRKNCRIFFVEVSTDYRTSETFKGTIGDTYFLEIITKEGKTYRSTPQKMLPTPPIDSLDVAFKEIPSLDRIVPDSGVEVFASWQDPPEEENFYFWRVNGIYKIFTPDLSDGTRCCMYDTDGGAMNCWILETNLLGNELAFSDRQVNGQKVTMPVGLVEDNGFRFGDKFFVPDDKLYYVEVEQYMMSKEAFEFNEKAKILGSINGEVFDPPPLRVRGNIFNIDNLEENVIGYFGAYSKQTNEIFIPRSLLKFTQLFPDPCGDCRTLGGAQTEIPEPFR